MAKSINRFHGSSGVDPDVSILYINYQAQCLQN